MHHAVENAYISTRTLGAFVTAESAEGLHARGPTPHAEIEKTDPDGNRYSGSSARF
jgi:hypothetical protein